MELTANQLLAVELLADPTNTDTQDEVAKRCKVHRNTLRKWRQENDDFRTALDKRTTDLVRAGRHEAYRCLMHNIRKNDRASARDFLQATGDIGTGGQTNITNVKQNSEEGLKEFVARITRERAGLVPNDEG